MSNQMCPACGINKNAELFFKAQQKEITELKQENERLEEQQSEHALIGAMYASEKAKDEIADLKAKLDVAIEALNKIVKFNYRGAGPGGCDNHCINHPCGPCLGLANEKHVAKQALKKIKEQGFNSKAKLI